MKNLKRNRPQPQRKNRNVLPFLLCLITPGAATTAQTPIPAPQTPAAQPPVAQTPIPTGKIPPRDPRLAAPPVQETTIPPPVVVPPPPVPVPDVPNRPLSADEAAQIALRLQPNILTAQANLRAQQGRSTQIRSGLSPQVIITSGYNNTNSISSQSSSGSNLSNGNTGNGNNGTGNNGTGNGNNGNGNTGTGTTSSISNSSTVGGVGTGFTATATLRQLIFDFSHTRDLVRQSVALERAATQNIARVQNDTVFQVKQQFYLYVQDLRAVTVNEQEVANRQSQLDLATARYNTGLGLPSDVVTAQTAKAEAIGNLTVARNNAEQARITLCILIGIDPRTPIVPTDAVEPVPGSTDVNALTDRALKQRPEILQAQETIRSSQYGVSAARTTNAPSVSGNVQFSSRGDQFLPQTNDVLVGVAVTWTPFDGGLTRGRVQEQRANVDSARAQLLSSELTVKSDVAGAYVSLTTAEQRVTLAQADVANAEAGIKIAIGRYATGIGQFIDILNAQAFLLTARLSLVTAEANVQQARAALRHAVGDRISPRF